MQSLVLFSFAALLRAYDQSLSSRWRAIKHACTLFAVKYVRPETLSSGDSPVQGLLCTWVYKLCIPSFYLALLLCYEHMINRYQADEELSNMHTHYLLSSTFVRRLSFQGVSGWDSYGRVSGWESPDAFMGRVSGQTRISTKGTTGKLKASIERVSG